jgi:hypothetical protein
MLASICCYSFATVLPFEADIVQMSWAAQSSAAEAAAAVAPVCCSASQQHNLQNWQSTKYRLSYKKLLEVQQLLLEPAVIGAVHATTYICLPAMLPPA